LDIQHRVDFTSPIPCILETLREDELADILANKAARKYFLRRYRRNHVVPIMQAYDEEAFAKAATKHEWPYVEFQPSPECLPAVLLELDWGTETWYFYRAWAVTRVLGRLPLTVFGGDDTPSSLCTCPLCGLNTVDVVHFLHACPATWDLYTEFCISMGIDFSSGQRLRWTRLRLELFADRVGFLSTVAVEGAARIGYVGKVMQRVAKLLVVAGHDIDELLAAAAAATPEAVLP